MMERPWRSGKFIISAGLKPLENKPIFPEEALLPKYLENKIRAREEDLLKHYPPHEGLKPEELKTVAQVLKEKILESQPNFTFKMDLPHRDEVDLILSQVPEDFSVWKMEGNKEWLALIHLSSANHWDARKKVGTSFFESHQPIPHIDPISKAAPKIFEQIQKRGPMERYAWGVATDDRLNHHPEPPPHISLSEWKGRSFDPLHPKLFIRMERQTLFPIDERLIGFTIKTTFTDITTLPSEEIQNIIECIQNMDEAILKYKGLIHDKENILTWLKTLL